jgi:hypothetical protein
MAPQAQAAAEGGMMAMADALPLTHWGKRAQDSVAALSKGLGARR